jgi:hypothetical protein
MKKVMDETTHKIYEETIEQVLTELTEHIKDLSDKELIHFFKLLLYKRNYKQPEKNFHVDCKKCNKNFNQYIDKGGMCIFCFSPFCTKCKDDDECPNCGHLWEVRSEEPEVITTEIDQKQ